MASSDLPRTIAGILGNIFALFLFLSPTPTFIQIWRKGSVEQFSEVPYLATFINCMIWVVYGLPMVHPHSTLVVTINGAGTFIELTFLILYAVYSEGSRRRRVVAIAILEVVFIGVVALLILTLAHTYDRRTLLAGILGILFNIGMYAAPLSVMKMVIRTKSVEYMPFYISLASFANGASWVCYALFRFDLFIVLPNGLGTLLSIAQLILYAKYYKNTKRILAARKRKAEVGLTEVAVAADGVPQQNGQ